MPTELQSKTVTKLSCNVCFPEDRYCKESPRCSGLVSRFSQTLLAKASCAINHVGGHGRDDKAVAGTALLLQAIQSKWHFHGVPGAHTTPGSVHLSTGTENKSQSGCMMHPRKQIRRSLSIRQRMPPRGTSKGSRSGMPVPGPTPKPGP